MSILIPILPEIISGATLLVGAIVGLHQTNQLYLKRVNDLGAKLEKMTELLMASDIEKSGLKQLGDGLKDQVTALEGRLMEFTILSEKLNKKIAAAEAKLCRVQDASLEEQKKLKDQLREEKKEMEKVQAERERLMKERYEQWERNQKDNFEKEKEHQRMLEKEAKEGLKLSHEEYERHMALERERLAKEEEFLVNAHIEHERCLKEERERFHQSRTNYERAMEEDRIRLAEETKTFQEAQKKWDSDRIMLEQNYEEIQRNLAEGFQQLRRDQRDGEEGLKSKMADLMAEQKNLTVLEKEEKLKDLTETYLRYCKIYAEDPDALTTETKEFQRKFLLQLTKVKNSMEIGVKSLAWFKVWATGAVLVMKMLTFLSHRGELKQSAIQAAGRLFRQDSNSMINTFNTLNALPDNDEEFRVIVDSFHDDLQEVENYRYEALPASASPHFAILASSTTSVYVHSQTWTRGLTAELECLTVDEVSPAPSAYGVGEGDPIQEGHGSPL